MSNVVRILTWIFLWAKSYGLNVTLMSSSGSINYYRDDVISLTCSYTDVPATATGFELRFNSAELGCTYDSGFRLKNTNYAGALTSPTGSMCSALTTGVPSAYNLTFTFALTESGNYTCYFAALQNMNKSSSPLQLALREKPVTISLSISPSVVFAGDQVTVQCNSTGGNPLSEFIYSVGPEIIPTGAFTATRRFNGMLLSCVDIIHSPYLGNITNVTTSENSLTVYYVEADTYKNTPCANETVLFQVISYLPASITPMYSWMKGDVLVSVSGPSYAANYNNSSSRNQTYGSSLNETYTCTVTGLPNGPRNVTFIISWDTSAACVISATTNGSDTTTVEAAQRGVKIGLGVGLGVGIPGCIIVITVGVYLKKKSKLPELNKRKGNKDPAVAETENGLSSSKKNTVHPKKAAHSDQCPSPKDSEVVYSEVQNGNIGTPNNRLPPLSAAVDPSQVNPERQLIYAEIDHTSSRAERKPREIQPVLYSQIDPSRTRSMAKDPR